MTIEQAIKEKKPIKINLGLNSKGTDYVYFHLKWCEELQMYIDEWGWNYTIERLREIYKGNVYETITNKKNERIKVGEAWKLEVEE